MSYAFRRSCAQLTTTLRRCPGAQVGGRHGVGKFASSFSRGLKTTTAARRGFQDDAASETNPKDMESYEDDVKAGIEAATKQQIKRPWQREGADKPPVDQVNRDLNKTMTKGKWYYWRFCFWTTCGIEG
jgi:hypothetical protein